MMKLNGSKEDYKMKKIYLFVIGIMIVCFLSGCTQNTPSSKQIKEDVAPFVSEWNISYYIDDTAAYYNTSPFSETLNPEIKSIEIEKSLSEDNAYEGWLVVQLEDDTIRPTAYLYVNYLRYDNNQWELQTCETYDYPTIEYIGNFNVDNVKQIFDPDIEISDIELLNYDTGNTAEVKIIGVNHKGLCTIGWDYTESGSQNPELHDFYDFDITFELITTFEFDNAQGAWKTSDVRNNLEPTTRLDEDIVETAVKDLFMELEDIGLTFPTTNYQFEGEFGSASNVADIASSGGLAYNFIYQTAIYSESAILNCEVYFGTLSDMPLFTYSIRGNIADVAKDWNIDLSKDRLQVETISLPQQLLNYELVYPYNEDRSLAYISVHNATYDDNSEHDVGKTYNVTSRYGGLEIDGVYYPIQKSQVGGEDTYIWDEYYSTIYITYEDIYFDYTDIPQEYKKSISQI